MLVCNAEIFKNEHWNSYQVRYRIYAVEFAGAGRGPRRCAFELPGSLRGCLLFRTALSRARHVVSFRPVVPAANLCILSLPLLLTFCVLIDSKCAYRRARPHAGLTQSDRAAAHSGNHGLRLDKKTCSPPSPSAIYSNVQILTYVHLQRKKSKQRLNLSSPVIIKRRVAEPLWDLDGTISLLQPFRRPRAAGKVRSRRRPSSLCAFPAEGRRGTSQQLRGALLGGGGCVRARA